MAIATLRVTAPLVPVIVTGYAPAAAPATVTVRTEDAVPPAGGVTGFVPKFSVKPPGAPETVRTTGEENAPTDCIVIVEVADAPGPRENEDGDAVTVKSAAPEVICTATSVLWVSAPLVPVMRNVNVPAEAPELAVIVNVDGAVPPDGGVTGVGSE
jgi:hypothetical protein